MHTKTDQPIYMKHIQYKNIQQKIVKQQSEIDLKILF